MKTIGVYKITCIHKPELIYIGSSSISIEHRWSDHVIKLKKGNHPSVYMQNVWNKYGNSCLSFEVVEICNPEDSIKREQYWIDNLKPLFNTCKIAGSPRGVKRDKALRDKLSVIRRKRIKEGFRPNIKKIIRSDGIIFSSVKEAAVNSNTYITNIGKVCRKKSIHASFYSYQYLDKYIEWELFCPNNQRFKKIPSGDGFKFEVNKKEVISKKNSRKIIRSDNVIFSSTVTASKASSVGRSTILNICKGLTVTADKYHFQFLDSFVDWSVFIKKKKNPPKKIICNETGQVFLSVRQAAYFFNKNPGLISLHLSGKVKTFCNLTFKYYEE